MGKVGSDTFSVFKEIFLECSTAPESCDELYDLSNKASTLAGAGGRQSSTGFAVPPGSASRDKSQKFNEKDEEGFCVDGSLGFCGPTFLSFTFWSFSSHGISQLCLRRRSAPLRKGVFFTEGKALLASSPSRRMFSTAPEGSYTLVPTRFKKVYISSTWVP